MRGLRRLSLVLGLCACGDPPRPVTLAQYQPTIASERWCRLDAGIFGFVPHPQVAPPLLGHGCAAPRRDSPPAKPPEGSTFAELVIEPGGSIEIPVQLPAVLQGAGCQLDSVMIAHGKRSSDLALEIASAGGAGRAVPIVSYAQLPPPPGDDAAPRTVVSDGSGRRKAIWAPDAPAGENTLTVPAEPELWPTGAVLRFDGGRKPDGAASIVFEIEPEPEPEPKSEPKSEEAGTEAPPSPQPFGPAPPPTGPSPSPIGPSPSPSPLGPSPSPLGPSPSPIGATPTPSPSPLGPTLPPTPPPAQSPSPSPVGPAPQPWPAPAPGTQPESAEQDSPEGDSASSPAEPRQPATLTLVSYRHRIDLAAPDSFSIVLRARAKPFGIGVRSGRESADPRLSYRAPGAAEPLPTHLVPQVGIVVSRCGRPVEAILRDIHDR